MRCLTLSLLSISDNTFSFSSQGTARVFFEDQTYRSVRIYSSFTTRDIIAVVLAQKKEKLPITRYLLSRVVLEQPFVEEEFDFFFLFLFSISLLSSPLFLTPPPLPPPVGKKSKTLQSPTSTMNAPG